LFVCQTLNTEHEHINALLMTNMDYEDYGMNTGPNLGSWTLVFRSSHVAQAEKETNRQK